MTNLQRAFFFSITHELRTPLNSIIGFNTLAVESGELTEFTGSFIRAVDVGGGALRFDQPDFGFRQVRGLG